MDADREAEFVDFARAALPRLRRVAYSATPDRHRADDLVQTTLEKMYRAWPRIERRDEPPLAYARQVLVRALVDEGRRPWSRHEVVTEPDRLEREGGDPAAAITDRVALARCLATLPPRQRVAVVLRHLEGLSVRETAAAMGCSEGTVKSTTSDGLRALRVGLEEVADHG